MSYATRTATVTLACPALIDYGPDCPAVPCEANVTVRVRSERTAEDGQAWWDHFIEAIASACGHALTREQEDRLGRGAVEELANRDLYASQP